MEGGGLAPESRTTHAWGDALTKVAAGRGLVRRVPHERAGNHRQRLRISTAASLEILSGLPSPDAFGHEFAQHQRERMRVHSQDHEQPKPMAWL